MEGLFITVGLQLLYNPLKAILVDIGTCEDF